MPTFYLLRYHKTSAGQDSPHFSEVSDFRQMVEAPRRLLSASIDSHFPPTQNNPFAKVAYFGVGYFDFLKHLQDLVSHSL